MRRIHIQKPLININPRNKKYIDKAEQILNALTSSVLPQHTKDGLSAELKLITDKFKLPEITAQIILDFQDSWDKQALPSLNLLARKIMLTIEDSEMPCYIATQDGKLFENLDICTGELEEKFADSEFLLLYLAPERKRAEVSFRGNEYRVGTSSPPEHPYKAVLQSITPEQAEKLLVG